MPSMSFRTGQADRHSFTRCMPNAMNFLGPERRSAAGRPDGSVLTIDARLPNAPLPKIILKVRILTAGADDGIRTDRRRHRRPRHQPMGRNNDGDTDRGPALFRALRTAFPGHGR